jgi:hypothetical protein
MNDSEPLRFSARVVADFETAKRCRRKTCRYFDSIPRRRPVRVVRPRSEVDKFVGLLPNEWEAIKRRQRNRCLNCGERRPLQRDHHDPHSQGGPSMAHNIRGLCWTCNFEKGAKLIPGTPRSLFSWR